MTKDIIILAGGASSRMKSSNSAAISEVQSEQANSKSKALIELHGRPMLDYLLYNIEKSGFRNIFIVVGNGGAHFKSYYNNTLRNIPFKNLNFSFVQQHIPDGRSKPLGTADAVFQALDQFPKLKQNKFVVCNCDNLYSIKALQTLRKYDGPNAFINYDRDSLKFSQERIAQFALTKTDSDNFLQDIIEKPSTPIVSSYADDSGKLRVSMNIFKLDGSQFYSFLRSCPLHPERNEKELPTALLKMVRKYPKSTIGISFSEHVPDLTRKEDIAIMNEYLVNHPLNLNKN